MQISKVNHKHVAVGQKDRERITGFIYNDPVGDEKSLEDVVAKRANDTKVLFNVFNTKDLYDSQESDKSEKDKEIISKGAKFVAKSFNSAITILKKQNKIYSTLTSQQVIKELKDKFGGARIYDDDIEEALTETLKKSFRKENVRNSIKVLIENAAGIRSSLSKDEEELIQEYFVKQLVEEYTKTKLQKNVVKSIKNQNMVIQPDSDSQVLSLSESRREKQSSAVSSDTLVNCKEKDVLKAFLTDYAVLDEDERNSLLWKLRNLVNLYFYGSESIRDYSYTKEKSVWKEHDEQKANKTLFIDEICHITKIGKNGKEQKVLDYEENRSRCRKQNINYYRSALNYAKNNTSGIFENEDSNHFWIHLIENEVERLYNGIENGEEFKFETGYISEKVWKAVINHLSIKYIALGKAVYNYAMKELSSPGDIEPGKIDDSYINGITSFDYEIIKAEESLQRDISMNVVFATNYLACATVDTDKDFLLFSKEDIRSCTKKDGNLCKNIMQFWGGYSTWKNFCEEYLKDDKDALELLYSLKSMLYSMRNSSFHFSTENVDNGSWDTELIGKLFEEDCNRAARIEKEKFYNNNLHMFYSSSLLEKVLERLYSSHHERASQVPSFNRVFVRKNFPSSLSEQRITPKFTDSKDEQIWQSAVYYLCKEIYYNDFLQSKEAYKLFREGVKNLDKNDINNQKAADSFKQAVVYYGKAIGNATLSQVCQAIMTEYNRQNNDGLKKKSAYAEKQNSNKYKHYPLFLKQVLQSAFWEYLDENKEIYGFISAQIHKSNVEIKAEDFIANYSSQQYKKLVDKVKKTPELQKWYTLGRLINPRQANQFLGSIRNYVQFVKDIQRRAKENGNPIRNYYEVLESDSIIKILEMCTKLNGTTSNDIHDYFRDEDEYAEYISQFVNFGDVHSGAALNAFCNSESEGKKNGIYYDGINPIVNRNWVLCKLYGSPDLISKIISRVNENMIHDFHKQEDLIREYQIKGICSNKKEQQDLRTFQVLKNRVELRDIVEYSEIINELYGQLIKWCYLRERDLMYFQLGFHYLCLNNASSKEADYIKINVDDRNISGAILYQIAAMYINGLPVYYKKDDMYVALKSGKKASDELNSNEQTSKKINYFLKYGNNILGDKKDQLYLAGLELFENVAEHENIIIFRNEIDHFHYFYDRDRSMLDLYSEVFDRFFTYDMKLRKNVVNMLYNILLDHNIVSSFVFETGEKKVGRGDSEVIKPSAKIRLRANNGVSSDVFTYKVGSKDELKIATLPAKNEEFLLNVARLIYYPDMEAVSENMVREGVVKVEKSNDKKGKISRGSNTRSSNQSKYNNKSKNRMNYSMGSIFEKMDLKFD